MASFSCGYPLSPFAHRQSAQTLASYGHELTIELDRLAQFGRFYGVVRKSSSDVWVSV